MSILIKLCMLVFRYNFQSIVFAIKFFISVILLFLLVYY